MAFWRMQLHPSDPDGAMGHTVNSIAAGFIGLDFDDDPGDLRNLDPSILPESQRGYIDLAKRMARGDKVLVLVHHFPFALVTVDSDYNYIARREPEIGVWFRHFRRINRQETRYYADFVKDAKKWDAITMTGTLFRLSDPTGANYRLIENWMK
ncbi:MAG TPA: hypothetical protein VHN77_15680 [Phycisphaerales bacterium]|nr:hypothetical protein [Phycisphaerales bacterium]